MAKRNKKQPIPDATPLPLESHEFSTWGNKTFQEEVQKMVDFFCVELTEIIRVHKLPETEFQDNQQIYDAVWDELRNIDLTKHVMDDLKKSLNVK